MLSELLYIKMFLYVLYVLTYKSQIGGYKHNFSENLVVAHCLTKLTAVKE